jgi:hypothetical protein
MIFPFTIKESSKQLVEIYPPSDKVKDVFSNATENERYGIIRLWITEGIPYAFKENPLLYEEIRTFVAKGVKVHPKEVTLVGSARIGYSLKPKVWGRNFTKDSDLDFTIISNELYTRLVKDFQKWVGDIESRRIIPRTPNQLKSWLGSIETLNLNINKGFIYTKNLFPHRSYPTVAQSYSTMNNLKDRLSATPNCPKLSDLSIRIYSSWNTCIRQIQINLKSSLNLWDNTI